MRKPYVIAEAGCNHCGDLETAMRLIHEARSANADAIKFQAYVVDKINDESLHDFLSEAQLTPEDLTFLKEEAEDYGLNFICSAFDKESVDMLHDIKCVNIKVPSGVMLDEDVITTINNLPFAKVFLSTGMSTPDEIKKAYCGLSSKAVVLMHCVSAYPCREQDAQIGTLELLKEMADPDDEIGYSDHCMKGIAAIAAAAQGYVDYIEHHFCLQDQLELNLPDIPVSFGPYEFSIYVSNVKTAYKCVKDCERGILDCERPMAHRRKK